MAKKKLAKERPLCTDFIVEAVRAVRRGPTRANKNASGVRVQDVYRIAQDLYTAREFMAAVTLLVRKSTLYLIWEITRMYRVTEEGNETTLKREGTETLERVLVVPRGTNPQAGAWFFSDEMEIRTKDDPDVCWMARGQKLYVAEDGVPATVQRILDGRGAQRVTASDIVARIRGRHTHPAKSAKKRSRTKI